MTLLFVRTCWASLLALGVLLIVPTASADALRDVDQAASGGGGGGGGSSDDGGSGSDSSSGGTWSHSCDTSEECEADAALAKLFLYGMYRLMISPWKLPRRWDEPCRYVYAPYPFAGSAALLRGHSSCVVAPEQTTLRSALDAEVESGFLLQGVVPATISLRAHLPRRFELSGRLSLLSDVYERPAQLALTGDAHVTYRHAQTSRVELRSGLGVRLFSLSTLRAGVDFMYAIDAYVKHRAVVRVELHLGNLGRAFAGQTRATIGMMVSRFELYAGYDHTVIVGGKTARLSGPVAGFRAWF